MKHNIILEDYLQSITKILLDADIAVEDVTQILIELDTSIHAEISDILIDKLPEDKKDEIDRIGDSLSDTEYFTFLHTSVDEVTKQYIYKLEDYLEELPQNIESIKKNLKIHTHTQ